MSDYLSNLAARALGLGDRIRPRLLSPFEPAPIIEGWAAAGPNEPEITEELRPDTPFTAARRPYENGELGQQIDYPAKDATPSQISGSTANAPGRATRLPTDLGRDESMEPRTLRRKAASGHVVPSQEAYLQSQAIDGRWSGKSGKDQETSNLGPAISRTDRGDPPKESDRSGHETRWREDPRTESHNFKAVKPQTATLAEIDESGNSRGPRYGLRLAAHRNDRETPMPERSGVRSQETVSRREAQQIGEPENVPTVRITIGSVEVRAIIDKPSAPQRIPAPKPRLSLADYLKERAGGRR